MGSLNPWWTGDGSTDDTAELQALFDAMTTLGQGYVLYIDAGAYVVSDTITVGSNTNIVGECWPLFVATASVNFTDFFSPRPMFQVGTDGEVGNVQIQQLLFTTQGATGGLVAVEWNMVAASQGSVAMWGMFGSKMRC
jgi:hypothetical protein